MTVATLPALDEAGRLRSDLWIDQPDALAAIERRQRAGELTAEDARQLAELCTQGYCVLRPAFEPGLFAELAADVERLWAEQPPDVAYAYQSPLTRFSGADAGFRRPSCRLADLHAWSEAARALYLDRTIFRFIELAFGEPAVATQSLFFEWGSQQGLHRDPAHVQMRQPAHLLAAWVALEDIEPGSGPLVYVPGSHRLAYYQFEPGRHVHDDRRDGVEGMRRADAWDREQVAAARLAPTTFLARRGEVLVWHHSLLHGGSVPSDSALTRRSFVIHYSTRGSMPEVSNSYLDPFSGEPGTIERRALATRRLLRAPGAVGFDSPLHDNFLREARQIAAHGGVRLAQRVAAMEASRFWRARNAWFALKRRLGITRER